MIQGSQSLFGVKSELQFGKLNLTLVASQQKSRREEIQIQGGSQLQTFEVKADQYDENRHFFLSHYNRDVFERALDNMPQVNSLFRITKLEVWVTNDRNATTGIRDIVTISDLGEPEKIANTNSMFQAPASPRNRDILGAALPGVGPNGNGANDIFTTLKNDDLARILDNSVSQLQSMYQFKQIQDFEKIRARQLSRTEYNFHPELGFISLNVNLRPDQVLGVAYEYTYNGKVYKVGEFSDDVPTNASDSLDTTADPAKVLFVKMLKSTTQRIDLPIWDLMMKNIYSIGAYQVNQQDFKLDIFYEDPGGGEKRFLPETNLASIPLLRVFNLDNLNVQGDPHPDGIFDFVNGGND